MADQAGDIFVETYQKVDIFRKQYDPYGGPTEYFYIQGSNAGQRSQVYNDLDTLKRDLDFRNDTRNAQGNKK